VGSLQRSPDSLAGFQGQENERGEKGKGEEGMERNLGEIDGNVAQRSRLSRALTGVKPSSH